MQSDKRFLHSIKLRNFLSFGPETNALELKPLNVLIGPNGSGKSNVIEALGLLRAAADDLTAPIRLGGGIAEWLWKGADTTSLQTAEFAVTIEYLGDNVGLPLRHKIAFGMDGHRFELRDEAIEDGYLNYENAEGRFFYYRYREDGFPMLKARIKNLPARVGMIRERLRYKDLAVDQSILSQRKDPAQYPEITFLGKQYKQIKLYREWNLGRYSPLRVPQKADLPNDFLSEDAVNLGLVLNELQYRPGVMTKLKKKLQAFYAEFEDITFKILGGTIQVFWHEKGLQHAIPTTRLSDGTLRYLCLLAILCHPEPPPLIAIEEPELGLHPDILPALADLLVEASQRTQLVVTTHSDILIDALSETPESIVVCEKESGATTMQRLDRAELQVWLKEYSLGQLWRSGEIGGNRW